MKKFKWCVSAAKLKINSKHVGTNVEKHALGVFCLALANFVPTGRTKAIEGVYSFYCLFFFFFYGYGMKVKQLF